jgi:hypothetical protein
VLADAGLGEQDVARRIAEWSAGVAERTAPAAEPVGIDDEASSRD